MSVFGSNAASLADGCGVLLNAQQQGCAQVSAGIFHD